MTDTNMNTGAASLSDEQIEALKAAALAATPQNIDSAQRIERYEDGSFISCPACGGEGNVELNSDFCNYDGEALGVQFYGIGNAHKLAEDYFRMVKPATALALIERLQRAEAAATTQADAAPIINGHAINDLFLKWSEWTTELGEAISRKNIDGFVSELRAAIAAGGAQEPIGNDWKYIRVKNFDALMAALDRSESKGYLPDAMAEEWTAFEFYAAPLPRIAATVALTDEQIYKLWCSIPTKGNVDEDVMEFARALLAASNGEKKNG